MFFVILVDTIETATRRSFQNLTSLRILRRLVNHFHVCKDLSSIVESLPWFGINLHKLCHATIIFTSAIPFGIIEVTFSILLTLIASSIFVEEGYLEITRGTI